MVEREIRVDDDTADLLNRIAGTDSANIDELLILARADGRSFRTFLEDSGRADDPDAVDFLKSLGGLDVGEFWDDPTVVAWLVREFAAVFSPAKCYCIRLRTVEGKEPSFVPYAGTGLPSEPIGTLPEVDYRRLLQDESWPVLSNWRRGHPAVKSPPAIASASWYGAVRVQSGMRYVGYLKVVLDQSGNDARFASAFLEVKRRLERTTSQLRGTTWNTLRQQAGLHAIHTAIARDLDSDNLSAAIQRLATLVTSHLGAGFNRIACVRSTRDGELECVYAHGGDCSDEWSQLQYFIARAPTLDAVQSRIPSIEDDPLYRELVVPRPLRIPPPSLLHDIWDTRGNLDLIPPDNRVVYHEGADLSAGDTVTISRQYTIAAKFSLWESWLATVIPRTPTSAIHKSRNGIVYVLPWTIAGNVEGLWLLDLGQWASFDESRDILPRLKTAKAIFLEFSEEFHRARSVFSGSSR